MQAEIVSVGTELLLGQIVNTDARFLSRELAELGINVFRQVTVGDNQDRLKEALNQSMARAELVITTGGLGPTSDDLTKESVVELLGYEMEVREEVLERIRDLYRRRDVKMPESNIKQAMFPPESRVVPNERGTAPGMILPSETGPGDHPVTVICLPGPTEELKHLWTETVRPYLRDRYGLDEFLYSRTLKVCGLGESTVEDRIDEIIESQEKTTVATYAKSGEIHIRLTTRVSSEEEGKSQVQPVETAIRERLGNYVYGSDDDTLEKVLGELLKERNLTLGTAESCTGGLLGNRLTNVPGSSDYFRTGIVAYANETKENLLGIPRRLLREHGAVSEPVARAMAEGLLQHEDLSVVASVTGIAGPTGGTAEKPVGTVYMGFAGEAATRCHHIQFEGDRQTIKHRTTQVVMTLLRRHLLDEEITN